MTGIRWRLVDRLSRQLEANERDAVLGDIAESNESSWRALQGVLGLVLRRQAALWTEWKPWLALIGLIGPVGMQLRQILVLLSIAPSLHLRTYWKYGVRYEHGLTPLEEAIVLLCHGLALIVWSWASGFVLGLLSGRTLWLTGALYFVVCGYPFLLSAAILPVYLFVNRPGPLFLMMMALQMMLMVILFVLPTVLGVRQSLRRHMLTTIQTTALAAIAAVLVILATWTGGWPGAAVVRWSGGAWNPSEGWEWRLLTFAVVSWPVGYLLARTVAGRRAKAAHS